MSIRDVLFVNILTAKKNGHKELLNELSLLHALKKIQTLKKTSFGLVSAVRSGSSRMENIGWYQSLLGHLEAERIPFVRLIARWEEFSFGEFIDVAEPHFMLFGTTLEYITQLAKRHNQPIWTYSGEETQWQTTIFYPRNKKEIIGEFHPEKIAQFYSDIKGKKFHFEYLADSWMEKLIQQEFTKGLTGIGVELKGKSSLS